MARTFYDVLGVRPWAAQVEIKRSFRRLAKRYHPDVNPGQATSERFLEIQAAYRILSNPLLRREYDGELEPRPDFHWDPPIAYDGPSHKVKVPRGYVEMSSPFPTDRRSDLREARTAEARRRFARRVWRAYVAVVLLLVAATLVFAVHLASIGLGVEAVITASGAGMMIGLLFIAWVAKGVAAGDL